MTQPDIKKITLLAMDVDGVLTDGGLIIHADGSESKRFHVHDGAWIRIWARLGFKTAIITGRQCPAVEHRARDLKIDFVYQNAKRKSEVFEQLLRDSRAAADAIAYIGDDVMDLPVLNRVGFRAVVDNALDEIKSVAHYITRRAGGDGAVGELIIHLLREKGLWDQAMERYRI